MSVLQWIALAALVLCFLQLFRQFVRIVKLGKPKDLSAKSGSVAKGIAYANTAAMSPTRKESAYMHLPTYAAGMLFHCGIFLTLLLFLLSLCNLTPYYPAWLRILLSCFLSATTFCGFLLFIKHFLNAQLRSLSNPDDYLSNLFTTLLQAATVLFLLFADQYPAFDTIYYICGSLLFLYIPFGKLRHLLYYFAARYHIGYFYGWRNVWPPQKK